MKAEFPAPWNLSGNGYIFLYRFPNKCYHGNFFSSDFLDGPLSGIGMIMLVDYHESTAGPYRELLFTPGQFNYHGKRYHSITKIYVSTEESVLNGRKNWGIPKELAAFDIQKLDKRRDQITVEKNGELILDVVLKQWLFKMPISTRIFPLPILQKKDNSLLVTKFYGFGKKKLAKIESLRINEKLFPNTTTKKPLAVLRIEDFCLEFPLAEELTERENSKKKDCSHKKGRAFL